VKRSFLWPLVGLLVACEPPPIEKAGNGVLSGGVPSAKILFPQNNDEISMDDNCELHVPIVTDFNNFELADPVDANLLVAGQGHYHVESSLTNYAVAFTDVVDLDLDMVQLGGPAAVANPITITVTVDMVDNEHVPLDNGESFALVEFTAIPKINSACVGP
jgi:hypothetical protein